VRNVVIALDQAAAALAVGDPVPSRAIVDMAQPLMPALAYMLMGDVGWLVQARRNHVLTKLGAQPLRRR
jgi:hypothetical protein